MMIERKLVFPNVIEINVQAGHVLGCNVYLLFDQQEWMLIDIGYEESVDEIIELIRQLDFPVVSLQDFGGDTCGCRSHPGTGESKAGVEDDGNSAPAYCFSACQGRQVTDVR
jgi:hypothetical protein